jgi:YHS domain-containing protein
MKIMQSSRGLLHFVGAAAMAGLLTGALTAPVRAGDVNTGYFGNVAIKGYDTVAYFTDSKPIKGSEEFAYDWMGATWYFANAEHRKMFEENPISYAPQYGGFCADGVSDGNGHAQVNIVPTTWQIIDGKLYLSAGAFFMDPPLPRSVGDKNWPRIQAELATQ